MGSVYAPCFSPDGTKLVFAFAKTQKKDNDLYVMDVNGNNLTQLTINDSYDSYPYWANDGNIYFTSDRGDKASHYQIWRFYYGKPARQTVTSTTPTVQSRPSTATISQPRYHTVQSGETITDIARKYGITVRDVVSWNNLTTMTISAGMKLKVSQ